MTRNLTFSNDFDETANRGIKDLDAVALHITGDRSVLSDVRCVGKRTPLLVNSPAAGVPARFYFVLLRQEGDVAFFFGRGPVVQRLRDHIPEPGLDEKQRLHKGRELGSVHQVRLPL